ncbi:MAG TPA: deoxyguanosinetriphosphate triphosphohydrolase, partial [Acidimicrobiales bacterium]|nr:deoxyguanosinetriphosphate triphosphohydrolase [Acidimicrobiales bacterium]
MTRVEEWAATMAGHEAERIRLAHADSRAGPGPAAVLGREEREAREAVLLAPGATRACGAGRRARPEEPDLVRTCFE